MHTQRHDPIMLIQSSVALLTFLWVVIMLLLGLKEVGTGRRGSGRPWP